VKKLEWIHPNKARIETGHKAFDRYCVCLGTGNQWGPGQFSNCIRPRSETKCNGMDFPPGYLNKSDLDVYPDLPRWLRKRIEDLDIPTILYQFFHFRNGKKTIHGYLVTAGHSGNHELLIECCMGPTSKSQRVLDWVKDYVSEPRKRPT